MKEARYQSLQLDKERATYKELSTSLHKIGNYEAC